MKESKEAYSKYKDMLLFKMYVIRNKKFYVDYWLCWLYNDKVCNCRITPTFIGSYRAMVAHAEEVESVQEMLSIAKHKLCA